MSRSYVHGWIVLFGAAVGCASTSRPAAAPVDAPVLRPDGDPTAAQGDTLDPALNDVPGGGIVAAGRELYRQQYCGVCHALGTAGTAGSFGPTHNGMGATAADRVTDSTFTGAASTAEEYILESIIDPGVYVVPGYERTRARMPAYTNLSEDDLNALVQLLLQER